MALNVYRDWLKISEENLPPDHYQLLKLSQFEDDLDVIRDSYRKLNEHVRKYASGQYAVQSQELLNELAKAMLCLTDPVRKQEYDQSLGREAPRQVGLGQRETLEELLVEAGTISEDQSREAVEFADARGLTMRDALVQMKFVDAETATKAYAQELALPYIDLSTTIPDDSMLDKIPRHVVKRNSILPLFIDDDMLLVACIHEPTPDLEEEIRLRYGVPMRPVLATPLAINQGVAKYYAPGMRDDVEQSSKSKPRRKSQALHWGSRMSSTVTDSANNSQIMILLACWAIIGAVILDQFILKKFILPKSWNFPYLATLIIAPIVGFLVFKSYRKS